MDPRLFLFLGGLVLAAIGGDPLAVFDAFQKTLGAAGIIGPICTAMGYAWVLKQTGADAEMVRLFTQPLKRVSWLLIPGGAAVGFFTNMAITSQTASAAAVGPVLFPIMRAAGYSPVTAAATILVGCSVGGNLFNPAEPDIVAIHAATGLGVSAIMAKVPLPNIAAFVVAVVTLMVMSWAADRKGSAETNIHETATEAPHSEPQTRRDVVQALLPPLPVVLLFLLQPAYRLVPYLADRYPEGVHISMVMVGCTGIAMIVTAEAGQKWLRHAITLTKSFFEGMGYAFANVISIIIAASCFIAGLEVLGVLSAMSGLMNAYPTVAMISAPLLTWVMAVVGGSGTAPSVAFSKSFLPGIAPTQPDLAVHMGVMAAIGANVGRTTSPVAAVVLFTSTLANVPVPALLRRVAPCMLASVLTTMLIGLFLRP